MYSYAKLAPPALGLLLLVSLIQSLRKRAKTTRLISPRRKSWLFGSGREIVLDDNGDIFCAWYDELKASVFSVPGPFGSQRVVLMDPKAIEYYFINDTFGFHNGPFVKRNVANMAGDGLLCADGESHKRQRKVLSPAFTPVALRKFQQVFYDNAHKVKAHWEELLSSSNEAIIDVQRWMCGISLDSIGIAGFAHDFGAIEGRPSSVKAVFDAFMSIHLSTFVLALTALAQQFPALLSIPTGRSRLISNLHESMHGIAQELVERSRKEQESHLNGEDEHGADGEEGRGRRTIIGSLLKAENSSSEARMSTEEVLAQMKVLLLAGNETTSMSLTWALVELALNPDKQEKLRAELCSLGGQDPTYEQLQSELPYLDAVLRETLRTHSPVAMTNRIAVDDHTIPLSRPVRTQSGQLVDEIHVARGTTVIVPLRALNRCTTFWGPDAKEFKPERWLFLRESGKDAKKAENAEGAGLARELHGFHHIMSFGDGPRICLGKNFAVMEFKAVLAVLIRHFTFALRDGPDTKMETVVALFQRPKVVGEEGVKLPMRVRRVE